MRLHELKPASASRKQRKRLGRGRGSGVGKTAGKGQKGQKARSGGKGPFFEGGQTPLVQRIPKLPGFKNPFKKQYSILNLKDLNQFREGEVISMEKLFQKRLVKSKYPLKILAQGELQKKLTVKAQAFSKKALEGIEKAGGKAEIVKPVESSASAEAPASALRAMADRSADKGKLKVESRDVKSA